MKFFKEIKINNRIVSQRKPVFIIAEAGVNHNGRLGIAIKMIDAAVKCGADAIKFQTFQGQDLVIKKGEMAKYQKINLKSDKSQLKMLKNLVLPEEYYKKIINHCKRKNIIFFSTPHGGFNSVDYLEKLSVPAYKIGSGDITNLPLLRFVAKLNKPIILSTGMATLKEVYSAVTCIYSEHNRQIILLHCTSNYPCPLKSVNLLTMTTLQKRFRCLTGYSDHTKGTKVSEYAVFLGAKVIEKHFTLDKTLPGPDQINSIEPDEFKLLVNNIRNIEKLSESKRKVLRNNIPKYILGSKFRRPNKMEIEIARQVRKSLVWTKQLNKNHIITKSDIDIKRPGYGIPPSEINKIIGKKINKKTKPDTLIEKSDFI